MDDLVDDPHIVARGTFLEVDGYPMPGVIAQLSATPGEVRWPGRSVGSDQASVFDEFGLAAPDTEE